MQIHVDSIRISLLVSLENWQDRRIVIVQATDLAQDVQWIKWTHNSNEVSFHDQQVDDYYPFNVENIHQIGTHIIIAEDNFGNSAQLEIDDLYVAYLFESQRKEKSGQ